MKNIFKIIRHDLYSIFRYPFVIFMVVAISALPALYAWFNIYASHDPYENTERIPFAVVNEDVGYNGVNEGEAFTTDWVENGKLNYIETTREEAMKGLRTGKYYAALVLEKDFSERMYEFSENAASNEPVVTFYQNDKLNAVASRITESAADSIEEDIRERYLTVMFDDTFQAVEDAHDDHESKEAAKSHATGILRSYQTSIGEYQNVIEEVEATNATLDKLVVQMDSTAGVTKETLDEARSDVKALHTDLMNLRADVNRISRKTDKHIDNIVADLGKIEDTLNKLAPGVKAATGKDSVVVSGAAKAIKDLRSDLYSDSYYLLEAAPEIVEIIDTLDETLDTTDPVFDSIDKVTDQLTVLNAAGLDAVNAADNSLNALNDLLGDVNNSLETVINDVESGNSKITQLINIAFGEKETYTDFFANTVSVDETVVYPVNNYGSAMAPFYTSLAIWVGGIMLVAVFNTHVESENMELTSAKEWQKFVARYVPFFIVGQIQTAITIFGDMKLLDVQCVDKGRFFLAGAVASLAFTMLIYALVYAFGVIGKAIAVIIVVLQVAASSGSYPIEILPEVFSKIYKFFPFPYSCDAFRECICGFYGNDYWTNLAMLGVFLAGGLIIGLKLAKPFRKSVKFMQEEMENTGVM